MNTKNSWNECEAHISERKKQKDRLVQRRIFEVAFVLAVTFLFTSFISYLATEFADCTQPGRNNKLTDIFALFALIDSLDTLLVSLWRDPAVRKAFVNNARFLVSHIKPQPRVVVERF